jgi:hypothetical protein
MPEPPPRRDPLRPRTPKKPQVHSVKLRNVGSDTMIELAQAWAEECREGEVEVAGGGSGVGLAALIEVWHSTIREALPRVHLPLSAGDPDLVVDLQAVFTRAYDEAGYARRMDYRKEPPRPLSPEDASWADALLRQKGLR